MIVTAAMMLLKASGCKAKNPGNSKAAPPKPAIRIANKIPFHSFIGFIRRNTTKKLTAATMIVVSVDIQSMGMSVNSATNTDEREQRATVIPCGIALLKIFRIKLPFIISVFGTNASRKLGVPIAVVLIKVSCIG